METTPNNLARFSSCRGVSFEINSGPDRWYTWPDRLSSSARSCIINPIQRSRSRVSSHFCDVENVEELCECMDHGNPVDIEEGQFEPPRPKSRSRLSIMLLDQGLFTVYKRLFVVTFALNIIALIFAVVGKFPYGKNHATLFAVSNIFALVLCRSEVFLRIVFWIAVNAFGWPCIPLWIKTIVTSLLQSVGGIHSGCGVSAIAWLVYAIILVLFHDRRNTPPEVVGIDMAMLLLLCLSSVAAFPVIRHLHHNVFERTHRFSGWAALVLLWAFITLTASYQPESESYSRLTRMPEFWLTTGITVLIIIPWITVRQVPVNVSSPSGHASIIKFSGGVKAGLLGRISRAPFSEWHAFGIISDNKDEHMMLAGAVGDFTKSLVTDPPRHLWVRQVHFAGLPYLVRMYSRAVLVATGSGICVFLSFLLQPCTTEVRLIWVTKGVEKNFGREIESWVKRRKAVIVHDTAVLGRPDVAQMSVSAAQEFAAEVVIVTSNPEGSRDVVNACEAAGIAAFGPIWDS